MRRIAASLAVSVTLWALEGTVMANDKRLRDGAIPARYAAFFLTNQCVTLISAANRPTCLRSRVYRRLAPLPWNQAGKYSDRHPARHADARPFEFPPSAPDRLPAVSRPPNRLRQIRSPATFRRACPHLGAVGMIKA
jgi:hypothetical protein